MKSEKFVRQYVVRSYEGDRNNNLRILTLLNIFQDLADDHAAALGFGLEFCIKEGMTWVGTGYVLEIDRLPKTHETIKVATWPSAKNKLSAYREFEVFAEDGKRIIRASSQWVLLNLEKRRPICVSEALSFHEPLPERAVETDFPKISDLDGIDETFKFRVRFDDIDLNKHINNAVYILWATEAVDSDFRLAHNPAKISINFRKEGYMGEKILVKTQRTGSSSKHSLCTYGSDNERELARVMIDWK